MTVMEARAWYDAEGRYNIFLPIKASDLTEGDRKELAKLFAEAARLRALKKRDAIAQE